ncbi:MAG: hypothetical protein KC680_01695 [Candidatus Peregrinibacteria bacterium]|nr:hypothetical protein [Candidatus Peregrinibacteria bacterium]MCB9807650.1 hypothetical protein [Candidatus Peribacteria bacterium]
MRSLATVLVLALLPMPVGARSMSDFELQCREALNIGQRELQPGLQKQALRDCIRDLAAEARKPAKTIDEPERQLERRQQAVEKAQNLQDQTTGDTATVNGNTVRDTYDAECRDQLGIEQKTLVQPGPTLGSLLRCIERKVSAASRATNVIRRRTAVEERKKEISDALQEREVNELNEELQYRSTLRRKRLDSQKPLSTTRYLNIRQSARARTDFTQAYIKGSTAEKRNSADQCRRVAATEWAQCIRNALSTSD